MNWCGLDPNCWQLWANIATAISPIITIIGLLAILFTVVATKHQLDEMSRARFISAFFEIYKLTETEESWKLRRFVYELSGKPGSLSDEEQDKLELVIRRYSDIGYLTRKNYLQLYDFLERYYNVVIRIWRNVEEHVKYERERRKDPHWARDLEWLANQAITFRLKYYPDSAVEILPRRKAMDQGKT